jgi:hypothetical protein
MKGHVHHIDAFRTSLTHIFVSPEKNQTPNQQGVIKGIDSSSATLHTNKNCKGHPYFCNDKGWDCIMLLYSCESASGMCITQIRFQ